MSKETLTAAMAKRKYRRRSDEERISELEARIAQLKAQQAAREKKDDPVVQDIPKVQRRLRKFAQLALDNRRPDLSNSTMAFVAGLERVLRSELETTRAAASESIPEDETE